ncbi:MAG: hypothetical protein JW751_01115 [Polyangiaceae bacterium]|nr:hypothetical protein [Polyangiaceae bacterium]
MSEALTTICAHCGRTLELEEDANYVRCPGCGKANVVESVPPWALAETRANAMVVPTPAPSSVRPSRLPPPPPLRRTSSAALVPPNSTATPRSNAPSPTSRSPTPKEPLAEELVAIRCEQCGDEFEGRAGVLQCPRCGAIQDVDVAPPWELTNLDETR